MVHTRALVSSFLRKDDESSEKFTNVLSEPVKGVKDIKLVEAVIPSTYPVMENYNDSFQLNYGNSNYTVTIPVKNYDGYQLATELSSLFATATGTTDPQFTFTDRTNKLTLTTTANSYDLSSSVVGRRTRQLLGLADDTSVIGLVGATEFPFPIDLKFPHVIMMTVNCFGFSDSNSVKTTKGSFSFVFIRGNEKPWEYITFNQNSDFTNVIGNRSHAIETIEIEFHIVNHDGVPQDIVGKLFHNQIVAMQFEFIQ